MTYYIQLCVEWGDYTSSNISSCTWRSFFLRGSSMLSFVRGPWYLKRFFIIATEAYISATQKMVLTVASNILNKIDILAHENIC